MKSYDERTASILRKYDERLAAKKRRKSIITRFALSAGVCAAAVAGVIFVSGDDLKGTTEIREPDTVISEPEPSDTPPEPVAAAQTTTPRTETTSPVSAAETTSVTSGRTSAASLTTTSSTVKPTTSTATTASTSAKTTETSTTDMSSDTTAQTTVTTTEPVIIPEPTAPAGPGIGETPVPIDPEPALPEPVGGEDKSILQFFYRCDLPSRSYRYSYWVEENQGQLIGEIVAYSTDPTYGRLGTAYICDSAEVSRAIAVAFDDLSGYYIYFS